MGKKQPLDCEHASSDSGSLIYVFTSVLQKNSSREWWLIHTFTAFKTQKQEDYWGVKPPYAAQWGTGQPRLHSVTFVGGGGDNDQGW